MIKTLIFDFDGLILETEEPIYRSWIEVYSSFNTELSFDDWASIVGVAPGDWDPYHALEQQIGRKVDRSQVEPQRRQRELSMILAQSAQPGVLQYLEDARQMGLKIGLASSSSQKWVTGHLDRLGLLHYFDCIRTRDDVQRAKPSPELYLSVLETFGLTGSQGIAFEDSLNGLRAAKDAGLFCVVVPNPITARMPLNAADLRLASLADLPLKDLLSIISNNSQF